MKKELKKKFAHCRDFCTKFDFINQILLELMDFFIFYDAKGKYVFDFYVTLLTMINPL